MGKLFYKSNTNKLAFILLLCLFVFSYFEYFFRERIVIFWSILLIFSIFSLPKYGKDFKSNNLQFIVAYIGATFLVCILQSFTSSSVSYLFAISQVVTLFSLLVLGAATKEKLLESLVFIMTIIALYSVVIYALCIVSPQIKYYLVNVISPNFVSRGVEYAKQEGGGINFVIYNFQQLSEYATYNRNCGPFWEPGMFAVFLDLALFVNLFLFHGKTSINIILTIALLTTMSTGGYVGGLFILSCYSLLKRKSSISSFISIILFFVFLSYFFSTDFLGDKLVNQMTNYQLGNDDSRLGAFLTHLKIFYENPLWGYFGTEGYIIDGKMALASGLLIPLSSRGIIAGLLYYVLLYKASINYSILYTQKKRVGKYLFVFILLLSFSQTILLTSCFLVFIFAGLLIKVNYNQNKNNNYASV